VSSPIAKILLVVQIFLYTVSYASDDTSIFKTLQWKFEAGYGKALFNQNSFDPRANVSDLSRLIIGAGPVLKINDKWRLNVQVLYNRTFITQRFYFDGFYLIGNNIKTSHGLDEIMLGLGISRNIITDKHSSFSWHLWLQPWYLLRSESISRDEYITDGVTSFQSRVTAIPSQRINFAVNTGVSYEYCRNRISWGMNVDLQIRQSKAVHYYYVIDGWFSYDGYYAMDIPTLCVSTYIGF